MATERTIDSLIEDLEYWTEQVDVLESVHRRRVADAAVGVVYRLHEGMRKTHGDAYWGLLKSSPEGQTAGAVALARGVNTHELFVEADENEIYPGMVIPGDDLFLGVDYRWVDYDEIKDHLRAPARDHVDRRPWYIPHLSQRAVAGTLRTTAAFYRDASESLRAV